MKARSAFFVFFLVALIAAVSAVAVGFRKEQSMEILPTEEPTVEENLGLRFKRVTCDLLTLGSVMNDSACAAHCLVKGFKGGKCHNGICKCRK